MTHLYGEFYKTILGPQQLYEDSLHPPGCTMFSCYHPWDNRCKTRAQEMHQWEDYALEHYRKPQIVGGSLEESLR